MIAGVNATTETANSPTVRLGFLQYDYAISANDDNKFVSGLYLQGFPSLARNDDLIFC